MKNVILKFAVLSIFGGLSAQASSAEITLPAAGFASSAYTNCYNTGRTAGDPKGNFGSYPIALANYPTSSTSTNSTCYVTKPASEIVLPAGKTGFTLVGSTSGTIPTATGAGGNIGSYVDYAWRNSTTNTCIIGTRVSMINADHDSSIGGTQYFEVNDIARGGFDYTGSGDVKVYYTIFASPVTSASPVYRVGRTKNSVQHRALKYDTLANKALNGTNYLDLPTKNVNPGPISGELTGINATTAASTTPATQDAIVNSNWVDFTTDTVWVDDDGSLAPISAFVYIEATNCTANPTIKTDAIGLRQTAQELTTPKEIKIPGYAIGTP